MKTIYYLIFILLFLFNCSNDNPDVKPVTFLCNVNDPIKELSWLDSIVVENKNKQYGCTKVYTCKYDTIQAIVIDECSDCLGYDKKLYDCSGNELCIVTENNEVFTCLNSDYSLELTSIYKDSLYKSDDVICNTNNPIDDFTWLQEIIHEALNDENDSVVIKQCIFDHTEGYIVEKGTRQFRVKNLLNCEGRLVRQFDGVSDELYDMSVFRDKIYYEKTLFTDTVFTPQTIEKYMCTNGNPIIELEWLHDKFPGLEIDINDLSTGAEVYQGYFDGIESFRISKGGTYIFNVEYRDCNGDLLSSTLTDDEKFSSTGLLWYY